MKLLFGPHCAFAEGTVLTIGNFDGVHLGHQALLAHLKKLAKDLHLPLVLLLFEPQPGEFFQGDAAPPRLSDLREKLRVFAQCGVDYVYCLRFNKTLAEMSAYDFADTYIFSLLQARYLLTGEDFRFGYKREGDVQLLRQMAETGACSVHTFADFVAEDSRVSSTKIRQLLAQGQLEKASALLGRNYSLCSRVIVGKGLGRQWGIPTANLNPGRQNLPLTGVFCVKVCRKEGKVLNGVANLGRRPTIDGNKMVLEIHLFDFDENLYGERIEVFFLHKLRDEIRFTSVDNLIVQIHKDIAEAKEYFRLAQETKINI